MTHELNLETRCKSAKTTGWYHLFGGLFGWTTRTEKKCWRAV